MTENKRYRYYEHKGADYILDNPNTELDFIEMLGDCLDAKEIVDLLNEQDDEIKSLKEDIKFLGNLNTKYVHSIYILEDKIKELKEENEQLKSVNMEMEDCLGRLEESNINLRIKLKKIRDYAKKNGEIKYENLENLFMRGYLESDSE